MARGEASIVAEGNLNQFGDIAEAHAGMVEKGAFERDIRQLLQEKSAKGQTILTASPNADSSEAVIPAPSRSRKRHQAREVRFWRVVADISDVHVVPSERALRDDVSDCSVGGKVLRSDQMARMSLAIHFQRDSGKRSSSTGSATWRGESLMITNRVYSRQSPESVTVSAHEEVWSSEGDTLVIRVTDEDDRQPRTTTRMTLRRRAP